MDRLVLSIPKFCESHDINRGTFYNLVHEGKGPTLMRVGSRVLISIEAAEAWRRKIEQESREKFQKPEMVEA